MSSLLTVRYSNFAEDTFTSTLDHLILRQITSAMKVRRNTSLNCTIETVRNSRMKKKTLYSGNTGQTGRSTHLS